MKFVSVCHALQYLMAYTNLCHFSLADAASIVNMTLLRETNVESVSKILGFAYELLLTNLIDFTHQPSNCNVSHIYTSSTLSGI